MKLIVLLSLIILAVSSSPQIEEVEYQADREYRYLFDGQLSSSLLVTNTQKALTRIQSTVIIQPETSTQWFRMKLEDIHWFVSQDEVEAYENPEIETMEDMPLNEKKNILELSLRFNYLHGLVGEIEFNEHDETWSKNIKRAVINMLQINYIKHGVDDDHHLEADSFHTNDFFKHAERTIEGECEVDYTRIEGDDDFEQWSKSINFEKCHSRPELQYGRHNADRCEDCDMTSENDGKLVSTVMNFNISHGKSSNSFLIHQVELRSQYLFTPLTEKEQLLVSYIFNKLVLVSAGQIENKKLEFGPGSVQENLVYNTASEVGEDNFGKTGNETYLPKVQIYKNKINIISEIFKTINVHLKSGIEMDTSRLMARAIKLLRLSTEVEIQKIHKNLENFDNEKHEHLLNMFYDSLALSGTKHSVGYLISSIKKNHVSPLKASQLFKLISDIRFPSELIANDVFDFCNSNVATRNSILHQSCWLTYGSILSGICRHQTHSQHFTVTEERRCTRTHRRKLLDGLVKKLAKSDKDYEKILFLKSLGNAANDQSIIFIQEILENTKEKSTVRVNAVDSLRRLRNIAPKKILEILMPIYKNRLENDEVRMTALNLILMTNPEQSVISQLMEQMLVEDSRQVRQFTYSSLKSLSQSTNACERKLSESVARALHSLPKSFDQNLLDSKKSKYDIFNNNYASGISVSWSSMFTSHSMLPKQASASLETVLFGNWNKHFLQVGFIQNNFDVVINNILKTWRENDAVVSRGKRSTSHGPLQALRALYEKLGVIRREVSEEDPEAVVYIRYKDMDYALIPIDKQTLPVFFKSIIEKGKIDIGDIERFLSTGININFSTGIFSHESLHLMGTSLGLPIQLGSKMPTVASVQTNFKLLLQPQEQQESFTGLYLNVSIKPLITSTNVVKMEVRSPIVYTGAKLVHEAKVNTPLNVNLAISWKDQLDVKTVLTTPHDKTQIAHIKSTPTTFVNVLKRSVGQYPLPTEKSVKLPQVIFPLQDIQMKYFEETGLDVLVSGHVRRPFFPLKTEKPKGAIVGDNDIVVEFIPNAVNKLMLGFELELFKPLIGSEKPSAFKYFNDGKLRKLSETSELAEGLSQYIENYESGQAYKHRIHLKAQTVGILGKTAEAELRVICDQKLRYCRSQVEAQRSAFKDEKKDWKMKSSIQLLYPKPPMSIRELTDTDHQDFLGIIESTWGSDDIFNVDFRIRGTQSDEQKKLIKKIEYQDISDSKKLLKASEIDKFMILIQYKVDPLMLISLRDILAEYKKKYFLFTTVDSMKRTPEGHAKITLNVEHDNRRYFDFDIESPEQHVTIKHISLPFNFPTLNIHRNYGSIHSVRHIVDNIEQNLRSECTVKTREVQTFDQVIYSSAITTCYSVLAKDCSSKTPSFSVLMKNVKKDREEKKIKVISSKNVIELEKKEDHMVVTVNGLSVKDEITMEKHGIFKTTDKIFLIQTEGVLVLFDGYQANIKLSMIYKNKQCGICGHYDNEEANEFRRADNKKTSNIQDFYESFLYKGEECALDDELLNSKRNFEIIQKSEEDDDEIQQEPELITRVVKNSASVCFSVSPVPQCTSRQHEKGNYYMLVTFKCLPKSDSTAEKLLRQLRSTKHINENNLSNIGEISQFKLNVPKKCFL